MNTGWFLRGALVSLLALSAGLLSVVPAGAARAAGLPSDAFAASVVTSIGAGVNGGDPLDVLGLPDSIFASFDNVGSNPGAVTVAFAGDVKVVDGPGHDVAIHVFDFVVRENERFNVFVSQDGVAFILIGNAIPISTQGGSEVVSFDLNGTGLAEASYIRIENGRIDFANSFEGPEIDAIEALHSVGSSRLFTLPLPQGALSVLFAVLCFVGLTRRFGHS